MAKADWLNRKAALAATLVAALLVSCSNSSETGEPAPDENTNEAEYLSLSIAVDAGDNNTRAGDDNTKAGDLTRGGGDPSGGIDGDGREEGFEYESKVNNATVFLVSTSDNNITANLDPTTSGFDESSLGATIAETYYFSSFVKTDDIYKSEEKQTELKLKSGAQYYALVVVNMGDLSGLKGKTLETLLKSTYDVPCVYGKTPSEATNFSMASTAPVTLTSSNGTGAKDDPFMVDVTVERLAARIDFDIDRTNTTYTEGKGYIYKVTNSNGKGDSGCRFVLESVIPFNMPNKTMGENRFKVVSSDGSTFKAFDRQETYNTSGYAEEYVLDKMAKEYVLDQSKAKSESQYGNYMSTSQTTLSTIVADNKASYKVKETSEEQTFYIVNYVRENVPIDNDLEYATGIILHGTFYEADECENDVPKDGATGEEKNYVYYIRHCNPSSYDTPSGNNQKMFYGIVRNNIYRMKLTQISVLKVDVNLKVKKWNAKEHTAIYI